MGQGIGMNRGVSYRELWGHRPSRVAILVVLAAWPLGARAQDSGSPAATTSSPKTTEGAASAPSKPPADTKSDNKAEVSSRDTGTAFKLRVNLVQVRVVVRDKQGKLVDGLKKEDFLLYDQGKLQTVSTFGLETQKTRQQRADLAAKTQQASEPGEVADVVVLPQRFVALVFDDIHLRMEDATTVRAAAKKLIESMTATDRIGLYGTSGQISTEFTSDKSALEAGLLQVVPRPKMGKINEITNCPDVNHYMADQYLNKSNQFILNVVAQEVLQCRYNGDQRQMPAAIQEAQVSLQQELTAGDTDNDFTYRALEDVLRRLSGMPGEKVLVLAGPGFLLTTEQIEETGVIDRANKANITINTLDARGLYVPDIGGDISQRNTDTVQTAGFKTTYRTAEQTENSYVMMDFALGTGGTYFHNSNDLEGGLVRVGSAPEICYVLGFSPQNQKMDGKYHSIKVAMAGKVKYDIQARRGYFSPKKADDPQEQAKQEIAEAVFSQEEIHELSVDLQTQYFKTQGDEAKLSIVSRIDLKGMHFRKENGRNWDNLTVATVIFDENGNYVTGGEKLLEMRLLDTTYERLNRSGLMMKSSFDLRPGKYVVRQVVRDSEGAQMAARNGAVVIPY
jgi:VWFA-related protein